MEERYIKDNYNDDDGDPNEREKRSFLLPTKLASQVSFGFVFIVWLWVWVRSLYVCHAMRQEGKSEEGEETHPHYQLKQEKWREEKNDYRIFFRQKSWVKYFLFFKAYINILFCTLSISIHDDIVNLTTIIKLKHDTLRLANRIWKREFNYYWIE